ncbi:leucine-rich PPR motif-containing protein, mitochondrial [Phlebotomus argentipes]|uniref:leucine-rich PPR motif-containing protein, mitochondrial n=1 Tax=Phlebotomus argentipes TaxID=94469 RepID=UPI0028935C9E|nr:leucine-rich PPR motif-containing protein, mitochondrial [Phlebotomus argentipes]
MALRALQRHFRIGAGVRTYLRGPRHAVCRVRLESVWTSSRCLSGSRLKLDDFYENLEKIRGDAAANHRIARTQFEEVISQLPQHQTSQDNILFLLRSCGTFFPDLTVQERDEYVSKIWEFIKKSTAPTADDYITLLEVRRKNRQCILDYKSFLEELNIPASARIYEELLYLSAECNLIDEVYKILAEMKEKQFPATEKVFNALILAHSRNRDLKNVELVLETMAAANVEQSPATATELIKAYVENKTLDRAAGVLGKEGIFLAPEQILTIVKVAVSNNVDQFFVAAIVKYLPEEIFNKRTIHALLRNLLTELVYEGKWNKTLEVLNSLPKPVFHSNEDLDGYATFLINDMIKKGCSAEDVIALCASLAKSGRNTRALHVAIEISLRRSSPMSLDLLQELSHNEELKPHYFWPLIIRNFTIMGEQGILDVMTEMSKLGVPPDSETINLYVLPRLSIILKHPVSAIKLMEDCGVRMSQLLTPLASNLLMQKRFQETYDIVSLYQAKVNCEDLVSSLITTHVFCTNTTLLGKLVALFASRSDAPFDIGGKFLMELVISRSPPSHDSLAQIIKEFFLCGVKISRMAGDTVEQFLEKSLDKKLATTMKHDLDRIVDKMVTGSSRDSAGQHIAHPRDMTLEELECHLVELEAKRLNTRGVLRRLLQLNVQKNKLDRAIEVKKLCDERQVDLSPGMLASIFDLHVKTKNLLEAEWTWLELKRKYPGFAVDEHKVINFASFLVEKGFVDEAKKVLTMRAATKIRGGNNNLKNVWQLLTNVAQHAVKTDKASGEVKNFLRFLVNLNYCDYHNTVLGPVVREHILRGDLPRAVAEFKDIARRFKKTPLKLELMTLILEVSNGKHDPAKFRTDKDALPKMMEEIMDAVAKIYGTANSQMTLIFALAEGGTDNQLRKLLIDPQFRINQELFQKQCDYLSDARKVEPLVRLARCTRGLGYLIKEQDMYSMLLKSFVQDNNHEAALELFDKICEDDELKLDRNFVQTIVDLLTRNNIDIPARVAIHCKVRN